MERRKANFLINKAKSFGPLQPQGHYRRPAYFISGRFCETIDAVRPRLTKSMAACSVLVASSFILPLCFRFNFWPWTVYPMFSWKNCVDTIWIYKIQLMNSKTQKVYSLPISLRKQGWDLVSHFIAEKNSSALIALIRAEAGAIYIPIDDGSYDRIVFQKASHRPGAPLSQIQTENVFEAAF